MNKKVCVSFVHKTKDLSICGKSAKWLINGKGVCWDCIAKTIINMGNTIDTATIKTIND